VDAVRIGRVVRALRHRRGWRQVDLGRVAGVSQSFVSRFERGLWTTLSWSGMVAVATSLGVRLEPVASWRGGDLDRLLDARHAALVSWFAAFLERLGWIVAVEATYNRYGERGSIDLLAFHPATGFLLVIEVKTMIADVQTLLRSVDVKLRLSGSVAAQRGWKARTVVGCLLVAADRTSRRRVEAHAPLFALFGLRGYAARRWLRSPTVPVPPGLLLFRTVPLMRPGTGSHAGRQRVRRRSVPGSVTEPLGVALERPNPI
jgi:transcriptional regulator with XRE-family HTH domain